MYCKVAVVTGPELTLVSKSVKISVTVSVPSNKLRVVVAFTENMGVLTEPNAPPANVQGYNTSSTSIYKITKIVRAL